MRYFWRPYTLNRDRFWLQSQVIGCKSLDLYRALYTRGYRVIPPCYIDDFEKICSGYWTLCLCANAGFFHLIWCLFIINAFTFLGVISHQSVEIKHTVVG